MAQEIVPAVNVAQNLQNRVGMTLGSLQMMGNPQSQAALLTAGATSIGTAVLTSIKAGQDILLETTDKVVELLTTQVEIQEEQQRRERESLAEANKEENKNRIDGTIPIADGNDKGKFKLDKDGMFGGLDVGDFAAIATAGGLLFKNVAGKLIKGGAKGGFYAVLASFLAKPAIDFIEEGILKVDIPEAQEKKLEDAIVLGATGLALAGIPGALIGFGAVGVNSLIKYIKGEQEKIGLMDATALFAGGVGIKLLSAKAVTALTTAGWVKSAGILGAITATPVLVAVGIGIALGVAVNELVKFNESVQEQTLKELEEITKMSREELSKRFAQQKDSFLEDLGMAGIADLFGFDITDLSKARIGTEQALDTFQDDPASFDKTEQDSVIKALDGILLANSGDLQDILNDQSKTEAVLDTLNAARQLAVAGAFGEERSKELLVKLLKFGSNIQVESKKLMDKDEGTFISDRLATGEGDFLEMFNKTYLGAQRTIDKNLKLIEEKDKEINRLENKEEELGLSREENDKLDKLRFDRQGLQNEITFARVDMKEFSARGLYKEGALGFKMTDFQSMFSDEELANLIKGALKNELLKIVNQNINETSQSDRQPGFDIKTGVSSNRTEIKHGDMITTPPSHTVDQHLPD